MSNAKLRLGLMLDGFDLPAWSMRIAEDLATGEYTEIVLVITANDRNNETVSRTTAKAATYQTAPLRPAEAILEWLYLRFIEKSPRLPDARALENARPMLQNVPAITATGGRPGEPARLTPAEINGIHDANLDTLLVLGSICPPQAVLDAPRYGVWALDRISDKPDHQCPGGFMESVENQPITRISLCLLNDDEKRHVLRQTCFSTDNKSVGDNMNLYYWNAHLLVTRAVRSLYTLGAAEFFHQAEKFGTRSRRTRESKSAQPPASGLFSLLFEKLKARRRRSYNKKHFFDQWILLYSLRTNDEPAGPNAPALGEYRKIVPPAARFWADPHIIHNDGQYFIFVEEYPYKTKKGHISVITMNEDGDYSDARPVLEKPYHLSYPFVFEYRGDYYMIPESKDSGAIQLYKCDRLPDVWTFQRNILEDIEAVDSTLAFHGGRWWLFANIGAGYKTSTWNDLFLFHADDPFADEWHAHPLNPIVSDCRMARPGGRVFSQDDRLYRVSQDCSWRYGYGLNFHEIVRLDENRYAERLVRKVEPDWDDSIVGTHTFNQAGSLCIADALYLRARSTNRS